jgi:hypothetical protein
MARRNPSLLDVLARAPWPVGLIAGAAVLIAAKVLPTVLGNLQNPYLAAIGRQFASGALNPLFWVLAGLCWLAALFSFLGQKKRQRLLEAQSGLDTLRAMSWRELEQLVSEAYRRQGYQVQETGQGGADGGDRSGTATRRPGDPGPVQALAHPACGSTRRARTVRSTDTPSGRRRHHRDHRRFHARSQILRRGQAHRVDGWLGVAGAGAERPAPVHLPNRVAFAVDSCSCNRFRSNMPDLRRADGQTGGEANQDGLPGLLQISGMPRNANALTIGATRDGTRFATDDSIRRLNRHSCLSGLETGRGFNSRHSSTK